MKWWSIDETMSISAVGLRHARTATWSSKKSACAAGSGLLAGWLSSCAAAVQIGRRSVVALAAAARATAKVALLVRVAGAAPSRRLAERRPTAGRGLPGPDLSGDAGPATVRAPAAKVVHRQIQWVAADGRRPASEPAAPWLDRRRVHQMSTPTFHKQKVPPCPQPVLSNKTDK